MTRLTARAIVATATAAIAVAGCAKSANEAPAPAVGSCDALAGYLARLAGADASTREREVASWKLDEATWRQTVTLAYRDQYGLYAEQFSRLARAVAAQLAVAQPVHARRHFADDPAATAAQVRLRWALPTLYPSCVAQIGGSQLDTVFTPDGDHWRALIGLDAAVLIRATSLDPVCAEYLYAATIRGERVAAHGPCVDIAYEIADGAVRADGGGFARACQLAASRQCPRAQVSW